MITVVDPDAARAALSAGDLACPESGCAGTLRIWSAARARHVQLPGGQWRRLRPDRARCRGCGITHVLLPAWYLPRRAYSSDVVGTALLTAAQGGAGYARAAAAARAPTATVRDWLRAVGRSAPALTAQALTVAGAAGEADACWTRPTQPCSALTSAVNALAAAARAFQVVLTRPRLASAGGPLTGIDYLAILAERHRHQLLHGLRLADPPAWQQPCRHGRRSTS